MLVISLSANGFRATEDLTFMGISRPLGGRVCLFIEDNIFSMKEGQKMKTKNLLKVLLCLALCLVMALSISACDKKGYETPEKPDRSTADQAKVTDPLWDTATHLEDVTLGEGDKTIYVKVEAGTQSITVTINTDAENLEDALTSVDLVDGEESEFGLYIKVVNGIVADYDIDQTYWGMFKDGEYLMEGANLTQITDGDRYELVRTK